MKTIFFYLLCAWFLTSTIDSYSQKTIVIEGQVKDENNNPLEFVNVSVVKTNEGGVTSTSGKFSFPVTNVWPMEITASMVGYNPAVVVIKNSGEAKNIQIKIQTSTQEIGQVDVKGRAKEQSFTKLDPKLGILLPDASGGNIEGMVKSQMGVSSNNELSSQYRVRGGNYDENLVYVNDIEIYRPFLIRSGQQEGLSFVNPDLISSLKFSPGGFESKYGDKMSSVLDVRYKTPQEFSGGAQMSLLGASAYLEGSSKDNKFSAITGVRYKTNQYLLGTLDTNGDYNPTFFDVQTFMNYRIDDRWKIDLLAYYSGNTYDFTPVDRETSFGTLEETKQLKIYFEGQEQDRFSTGLLASSLNFMPNPINHYKLTVSQYRTYEEETFDILGQYFLQDIEPTGEAQSSDPINNLKGIGVGSNLEHARNALFGRISNMALQGKHQVNTHLLSWETKYQNEYFKDYLNEWKMRDSSGYSLPYSDTEVVLAYSYNADLQTNSNRLTTYIQDEFSIDTDKGLLMVNIGVRTNYWDYNNEFLLSPRLNLLFHPQANDNMRYRLAGGLYYQTPFYRELRTPEGTLNPNIKAQKSTQILGGIDKIFTWNGRPFTFTTEAYYKHLENLISYQIDNVRIRYSGENDAVGYATGIDFKINGEFVPGVESWANLSFMKSEEDIINDSYQTTDANGATQTVYPGYIPRPSDQRVNFSIFFQDYLPNNPTFKVNLNLLFGTGLPFGPPQSPRYMAVNRMPPYRRVDIGFSKDLRGQNPRPDAFLKSFWLSLEVFNLFDINNTISYFWVTDIHNQQYAVPNYLTSRRLNLKIAASF